MSPDASRDAAIHLAAIVASSTDAISSHDAAGNITSWNAAAERLFGYAAAEVIGGSTHVIIPPEFFAHEDEIRARVRSGHVVAPYDTTRITKDGRRLVLSLTVSPLRAPDGSISGTSAIAHDVGDRTQLARQLAHFAAIVDSSDDAIISKDLDGIVQSWNLAAERLLGYRADEMIGQSIRRIVPADLQTEEDQVLDSVRQGKVVDHFETVRVKKDGSVFPIALTVSPIRSQDGTIIGASKIIRDLSRLNRARRDVSRLAAIVDSSDDAIVSKDLDSTVRTWNAAAERMFGYTADEMIGKSIRLVIPDDRQQEEDEVLTRVKRGERIEHFETVRQRKDGSFFPVSLTVSPIVDQHGAIIGASKIARDMTETSVNAIAARRLAAVIESSDDAIITKDLNSTITSWNVAAEHMFGYTAAEAIGRSIRMLIPDELQGEEDLVLGKIRAGEKIEHFETTRLRQDGRRVAISLTVSPIRDSAGRVVGASKIARDVTERVELERVAKEHARNTEKLGEIGALVASKLDRESIVERVTELGRDLLRAQWAAFFFSVTDEDTRDESTRAITVGASAQSVAQLPRAITATPLDPTRRPDRVVRVSDILAEPMLAATVSPLGDLPLRSYLAVSIRNIAGDPFGMLVFGHGDPAAFSETHAQLAVGVASWAAVGLENARLFVEANEANRLKDEFLAVLSHELRTPLNAIVGYTRLLSGGVLTPEKAARGIEILERNATWLTQIVEDVLDVSRIISGKIRLDVQPVDVPLVVENAIATVQPAADAKNVRVNTLIDPRVSPVSGDPGRLQQVVWNLLSNAVKFTPKGGRVQLRVERVNSHLEIVVSDTGAGIRTEFLPYVFERFRQEDSGTTRASGGLGLGLAIVRHIVEMHGGTVQAASAGEGQGASFTVCLPVMIVQPQRVEAPREHPQTMRRPSRMDLADLRGIRVLAVDDEEDGLTFLRVALEAAGADVTTIGSPREALEAIEGLLPDVLVLDLGMPEIDGFELIKRIRASTNPAVSDIPATALTAFARAEDRTRALRSGFEMHLAKPVDPSELVASVATLARRTRSRPKTG